MYNMGNLSEISEEQEEAELRDAFKVFDRTGNGNFFKTIFIINIYRHSCM